METSTGTGPTMLYGPRAGKVAGIAEGMVFDGLSASIAAARAFTAGFLDRAAADHGARVPRQVAVDAQLVVSELATNAVRYAAGPYAVRLGLSGRRLEITVWDTQPGMPAPPARRPEPGRVGQHGLEVVEALCESFEVSRDAVGKHVTAVLALGPAQPAGPGAGRRPAAVPGTPREAGRCVRENRG